jgi:PAS domain S-box-containing protein
MSDDSVKLGLMPPLTGLVGIYGSEIARAGQIARDEVNENGGVLGRRLKLVIEDDGSLPDSAVAAAEKLVDRHRCVAIIGNLLSNSRIAVAYRVAEPRKIPLLNFSFYEGSILSRYFFHFAALPNQQIDRMIPWMREMYGPRMFFAGNNYEWPRGSIDAAKRALEGAGGEAVGEAYCPIGVAADAIERLLDSVEASAPDVFVPYFAGVDQVNLLTRFSQRGLKQRMAVVMGHYDEMMASQLAPDVRAGFYSSNSYFMGVDSAENRAFLTRLANQPGVSGIWPQGNGILTNFGEGAYLCVKAFAQAANAAGSLEPEALVEALRTISITSPQGRVDMDPVTQHARVNTYLARYSAKGAFNIIERFGAIDPIIPARYKHQRISQQATLEDDIRLQARMLEQMSEAVLLVDARDEAIVFANTGAEVMFGFAEGELIGRQLSRLLAGSDREAQETSAHILRELAHRGSWQVEFRSRGNDGALIWCAAALSTFTHPRHGEVVLLVCRDIRQVKALQNQIEAQRQQLESLVQVRTAELMEREKQLIAAQRIAQLGHWSVNLRTGELHWSDQIYRIFGRDPATFLPSYENFFACVHPDDHALVKASEAQSLELGWHSVDHRVVQPDGAIRWVHEEAQLERDAAGEPLRLTGVVQDITARKRVEAALIEARDEAERANQAKSEFLSRMSHELRTPLNAILGFGQLLERANLGELQSDNVREILHAGRHLLELINEVLDLARIESGKFSVSLEPVPLRPLIADCLGLIRPQAENSGIELSEAAAGCDESVLADPTRLKQVLLNLLSNAVKYNRAHGKLSVTCLPQGDAIQIRISDTGAGLSPEQQRCLFKPFERLDADRTAIEGSGIGLALSKRLVEAMGGQIGVDSTPGAGSTFWVRLPMAEAQAEKHQAAGPVDAMRASTRQRRCDVLYIEDNPANLRLVERILALRADIRLLGASAPGLGLELAAAHRPALILLDINLPEMDGYAVLRRLRANPATREIPVLAISANAMPDDLTRGQAAGFVDYLTKPLDVGVFLAAVDAVLLQRHDASGARLADPEGSKVVF